MPKPLYQRVLFRLHWIAGITAGLVLAVIGATGGLLGFEEPILGLLNPAWHVAANGRETLPPQRWIDAARAAHPELTARSVEWNGNDQATTVRMAADKGRSVEVGVDPYTAVVLGSERGSGFFHSAEQLHRTLAAGPIGKRIVGASTVLLILLILTGIYLRWPRRAGSLSTWLTFNFRLKGRGLLWNLHAVAGTWVIAFYLIAALTGLWWSYDFVRNTVNQMAGVTTPLRRPQGAINDGPPVSVDRAWVGFRDEVPDATHVSIGLSSKTGNPVEVRFQTASSPHHRAWNTMKLDAATGAVVDREIYADQPKGRRFVSSLFPLHSGDFFGWPGRILMAIACLLMPLFAITGIWMWMWRRRNEGYRRRSASPASPSQTLAGLNPDTPLR